MKIPITYAEAKQRHPKEVAACVRALRASSSTHKAASPSKLEWEYSISVSVEGITMDQIRSGEARKRAEAEAKLSLEERIKDQLERSKACLVASVGRWLHGEVLDTPPPEWEKNVRREIHKLDEERRAYEALPESEKELRKRESLAGAMRLKGFAAFSIPESPKPKK